MLNIITIGGRLTKDPELRMTQSQKPVASFTVACERDFAASGERREADFIDCVAWNGRDGNKRRAWEIIADRVYFGESKRSGEQAENKPAPAGAPGNSKFSEVEEDDGELPFD